MCGEEGVVLGVCFGCFVLRRVDFREVIIEEGCSKRIFRVM